MIKGRFNILLGLSALMAAAIVGFAHGQIT